MAPRRVCCISTTACASGWASTVLGENFYSYLVAWLKIILPIAALALLSTLFLLSRSVDPTTSIPFADVDLAERARDQGVTAPYLAGATLSGDLIAFSADRARPDPADETRAIAENIKAWLNLTSGTFLRFRADNGTLDEPSDRAHLHGDVHINSSIGYVIQTQALTSAMREIWAESEGQITGNGPPGTFSAGKMLLRADPDTQDVHLLFTNGVKLIYDPKKSGE